MSQFSVISADNQVTIELHPDRWRLVQTSGSNVGAVLFEAAQGHEITYTAEFGSTRLLPEQALSVGSVQQVLLGWSPKLAAWQLGLLLKEPFATQRGSRWIELARWNDPDGGRHSLSANRAGSALARVMRLPFKVIAPRLDTLDDASAEQAEPTPLPALPLDLGQWVLERDDVGLHLIRQPRWSRPKIQRILWFGFWFIAFTVVSALSLTVKLALPNAGTLLPIPELLPYLGFAVAAVLLILILLTIRSLLSEPDEIVISPDTRSVTARRGSQQRWQASGSKLVGVYASEILTKRGNSKYQVQYTELNLHMGERKFLHLIDSDYEETLPVNGHRFKTEITPLDQNDVQTHTQAAAVYVAQALGDLPCWTDVRTS